MKLVYKTIVINTLISLSILFIGEWSLYAYLRQKIEKETIEHLEKECHYVQEELEEGTDVYAFENNVGDDVEIEEIDALKFKQPLIEDVVLEEEYEEDEKEAEMFTSKRIVFDVTQKEKIYRVAIYKTTDEDEDLTKNLFIVLFLSGACMLLVLVTANVFVYNKLFSPVSKLIREIKNFSIQKQLKIIPPTTTTKEFAELGDIISSMSQKNIEDYVLMKEFTENMAHEIQTPLAVISTKIEHCMQDKDLTENQALLLSDANITLSKLFNLNKGLTLLSKLDNRQYNTSENINMNALIKERVLYFSDFIDDKKIEINETYANDIFVQMEKSLSEILIDNLLKNAIKHNVDAGKINITIVQNRLEISNTGDEPKGSVSENFNRFYSKNPNESLGLGLSIVKKITEYYHFKINYIYENNNHQISIQFKP